MTSAALRRRSEALKKKWPAYAPMLAFYVAVREAQLASKPEFSLEQTKGHAFASAPEMADMFPIDGTAAVALFEELCRIGRLANPHFAAQVDQIETSIANGKLVLEPLFARPDHTVLNRLAEEAGVDTNVLNFLVRNAVQPSVDRARDAMLQEIDLAQWKQAQCPVCGAQPTVSLFKGEPSLRLSVCSYCYCEWPVERLPCSVCGKNEKDARAYFHNDGQEAFRIDTCDTCQHYIKTIDFTRIEVTDPTLEDLATSHLDVVAIEKGYARSVPNGWSD